MMQQPQVQGEDFHFVGQNMTFNPVSPPPAATAYGTPSPQGMRQDTSTNKPVTIVVDEDENNDASKSVKKRFWTHDEEERLVITHQFNIV
jgi:hypothetical protein